MVLEFHNTKRRTLSEGNQPDQKAALPAAVKMYELVSFLLHMYQKLIVSGKVVIRLNHAALCVKTKPRFPRCGTATWSVRQPNQHALLSQLLKIMESPRKRK